MCVYVCVCVCMCVYVCVCVYVRACVCLCCWPARSVCLSPGSMLSQAESSLPSYSSLSVFSSGVQVGHSSFISSFQTLAKQVTVSWQNPFINDINATTPNNSDNIIPCHSDRNSTIPIDVLLMKMMIHEDAKMLYTNMKRGRSNQSENIWIIQWCLHDIDIDWSVKSQTTSHMTFMMWNQRCTFCFIFIFFYLQQPMSSQSLKSQYS